MAFEVSAPLPWGYAYGPRERGGFANVAVSSMRTSCKSSSMRLCVVSEVGPLRTQGLSRIKGGRLFKMADTELLCMHVHTACNYECRRKVCAKGCGIERPDKPRLQRLLDKAFRIFRRVKHQ